MSALAFARPDTSAIPIDLVTRDGVEAWLANLSETQTTWVRGQGFAGQPGRLVLIPDGDGTLARVGYGDPRSPRKRFAFAALRDRLPEGSYYIAGELTGDDLSEAALGWLLAGYSFERYKSAPAQNALLVAPEGVDATRIETIAAGETLTRDLINTPAEHMGPSDLEISVRALAENYGARISVITGDTLLNEGFPLVHAVGRAADRAPRLIDMRWGKGAQRVTLVGKGVCFDTGGLNLKPVAAMGLMKKDMGGAAMVLGLARMIMGSGTDITLRVLIPAVENAVSGNSFRPGDILTSRKGLTIEINNTDAEGRLVLADALALADEEETDLIVSMATLTGAARVAVGPDLAPFYTDDEGLAAALSEAARRVADPVWRLPFHMPYETMIEPRIADLDNAPKGGFAGSITAALFLRRFVERAPRYLHFDVYGWQPTAAPGRPVGGVGQGTRALFDALPEFLGT
ncbi:MAG: leucyl aminopeptidase family protein [Pseudomonadota bacterium]